MITYLASLPRNLLRLERDDITTIVEAVIRVLDGKSSDIHVTSDGKIRERRQGRGPKANTSEEVQGIKKKESAEDRNTFLVSTHLSMSNRNLRQQRS